MHGKTTASALWCPSAEQIVQTVHSHLLFSPWYIVCALAFHSARKVAFWAYKQTVQKRASHPLPFPGELAFLFRLQAVKDLESLCQCPELIALSWSKRTGYQMSRRCLLITFPPGFWLGAVPWWWPLSGCYPVTPGLLVFRGGHFFHSSWKNLELPGVKKNIHLCNRRCVMDIFVLAQGSPRVRETTWWHWSALGERKPQGPSSVEAYLVDTISKGTEGICPVRSPSHRLSQKKIQ